MRKFVRFLGEEAFDLWREGWFGRFMLAFWIGLFAFLVWFALYLLEASLRL